MLKVFLRTFLYLLLVAVGVGGVLYWRAHQDPAARLLAQKNQELEAAKKKLEADKEKLETAISRLTMEHRVAQVVVEGQQVIDDGPAAVSARTQSGGALEGVLPPVTQPARTVRTTLLFVEQARDGTLLPGRRFVIDGNVAHFDALVIKFEHGFIAADDALRGRSIALFCRVFGENQAPQNGMPIDSPGRAPEVYNDARLDPEQRAFEQELWKNFWKLTEDKQYRQAKGVRVADGEDVWGPFLPDRLYTMTLGADGSLSLVSEPMPAIYAEVLRHQRAERDANRVSSDR